MTTRTRRGEAYRLALRIINGECKEKNVFRRLTIYEDVIRRLVERIDIDEALVASFEKLRGVHDQIHDMIDLDTLLARDHAPARQGAAWTPDEDAALVNGRVEGYSLTLLALEMRRTPAACAARLSTLTGIPRSEIERLFLDGELDGAAIRGLFEGRTYKARTS